MGNPPFNLGFQWVCSFELFHFSILRAFLFHSSLLSPLLVSKMRLSHWGNRKRNLLKQVMRTFDIPMGTLLKQWHEEVRRYQLSFLIYYNMSPSSSVLWLGAVVFCRLRLIEYPYLALEPNFFLLWLRWESICIHPQTKYGVYCTLLHDMLIHFQVGEP